MAHVKKFYRSKNERIIFGVCGGLANYFQVDPVLIRILFIFLAVGGGSGVLIYLILALITPLEPGQGTVHHSGLEAENLKQEFNESRQKIAKQWQEHREELRNVVGLAVVAIGVMALVGHFFSLFIDWSLFVSLCVIFIGLALLIKSNHRQ